MGEVTADHPHMDDPRFLTIQNQMNNCLLRFTVFARCARELGEEDVRCNYQYYRAQCCCQESLLEDWREHRARGSCHMDVLPDRVRRIAVSDSGIEQRLYSSRPICCVPIALWVL